MSAALRLLFVLLSTLAPVTCPEPSAIRIDGHFDDWQNHQPILRDDPSDAPNSLVDFGDLQIASDHLRLKDEFAGDVAEPLLTTPDHWYYMTKLEFGI